MHKLKDAVKNVLKLKDRVYQIFKFGELPLSNNSVEQSIRPSTIIRKNSLFAKSTAGAEANAIFYTIVQTAKLNNLDVFKYLELIFEAYTLSEPGSEGLFAMESNRSADLWQIKSLG